MPDPAWPSAPPEANYLRLVGSGAAGTGTTLASAAIWQAVVVGDELAASVSTANTASTALNFEGVGGVASASSASGLNTSLHMLAGWAQEKAPIAASAVAAYETAVSSMVPAELSLANRAEQAADVALNPLVLGALTPAIVALDLIYFGEHWPHNASAGSAYGAALTALLPALAVPPPVAPPGASPAAPVAAAAAVAETAGQVAVGEAGQVAQLGTEGLAAPAEAVGQLGQLASMATQQLQSMVQPLIGMFQAPMQAAQSMAGLPLMLGQLTGQSGLSGGAEIPPAMFSAVGAPGGLGANGGIGSGPVVPGAGAVGIGNGGVTGGVGVGGLPGAGLTSYTRPTSTFAPENGRPAGLKTGLLGAAELRGATATTTGGPVPVTPAHTGMLGPGKGDDRRVDTSRARISVPDD